MAEALTEDDDRWTEWPACPRCDKRRQTVCPICQSADDNFPLAEYLPTTPLHGIQPSAAPSPNEATTDAPPSGAENEPAPPHDEIVEVLLMCLTCDEAFEPRFYRRCAGCGHQFEDGVVIDVAEREQITQRSVYVVAGLLLGFFALLFYFWWVLR